MSKTPSNCPTSATTFVDKRIDASLDFYDMTVVQTGTVDFSGFLPLKSSGVVATVAANPAGVPARDFAPATGAFKLGGGTPANPPSLEKICKNIVDDYHDKISGFFFRLCHLSAADIEKDRAWLTWLECKSGGNTVHKKPIDEASTVLQDIMRNHGMNSIPGGRRGEMLRDRSASSQPKAAAPVSVKHPASSLYELKMLDS